MVALGGVGGIIASTVFREKDVRALYLAVDRKS